MFKIIIISQFGADRYQNLIFETLLLSPLRELWTASFELLWRFVARLYNVSIGTHMYIILTHALVMFWYPTYGNL